MNGSIIELKDVSLVFDGVPVLRSITFDVRRGESLCITGPSGSGKTLLLKLCAGLLPPTGGSVLRVPLKTDGKSSILGAGFVFEYGGLLSNMTVFNNVALPLRYHTMRSEEDIASEVEAVLARMGLMEFRDVLPARLSLGTRKLVSIARAIAMRPQIIYYDEPTLGLDHASVQMVESVMRETREHGVTSIAVSHSADFVRDFADRAIVLGGGAMLGIGTVSELSVSQVAQVRAFFAQ